ncbi:MAG: hypothetical protein JU82_01200 [Sulfuricurvum sp. MLSB]|uniref:coiled-coil domain-containing protein n=1 Tax=unclassified Sulfuricurvum TaxID=2632390 RepID=UPI000500BCED|nr:MULTISPECIES: hypothetical protein [unclassified Sulfuricurvum]KFN40759.1 MAG: hypothetical protein JU82_01200 [Sulfuricurvum sp. MLSB]
MNHRIVADITALLDTMLPRDLYAHDFTDEHYRQLLKKLSLDHSEELFNDKKSAIRRGIIEHFARTFQQIDIELTMHTFILKKQYADPSLPESFDRMVHRSNLAIIDIFRRKSEFLPVPYLLSVPEEIRTNIMQGFTDMNVPIDTARSVIRQQFSTVFDLYERDILFFLRGRISIRYFTPPKKLAEGEDKRFAGESVEEMEALYQTYFPKGAWEDIESILDEVISEKLNFSIIDNATFTRTFIPVFRSMIEILLLEVVAPEHRGKIEGFTGFVLRQHFHPILLHTAKILLEHVENRDKNAEHFIKYFSEEVVIDAAGKKIQKYAIIDSKQQRWNYTSILSIMMQYKQAKLKVAAQKEAINAAQERINECEAEITVERNARYAIMDRIAELESIIADSDTRIMYLKKKLTSEDTMTLKSDIARLNTQQQDFQKRKKNENTQLELANGKISNKTNELTRRQKKLADEKKSLQAILEQTATLRETYEMLTEALSLVLAKR